MNHIPHIHESSYHHSSAARVYLMHHSSYSLFLRGCVLYDSFFHIFTHHPFGAYILCINPHIHHFSVTAFYTNHYSSYQRSSAAPAYLMHHSSYSLFLRGCVLYDSLFHIFTHHPLGAYILCINPHIHHFSATAFYTNHHSS